MDNCYLCGDTLFEKKNKSKEHIILNSIGGILSSKDIICKECNAKFGHNADKELAHQLAPFTSLLQIKASGNNEVNDIKGFIEGEKEGDKIDITLKHGYSPMYSKLEVSKTPIGKDGIEYKIMTRTIDEMTVKLGELTKRFPGFDLEDAKSKIRQHTEFLDKPVNMEMAIGENDAKTSIVKSAVNYYIHTQKSTEFVQHLIPYLKGEEKRDVCHIIILKKPIYRKEPNEVIHLMHLVGDKSRKVLYCYVEYFSTISYVVILNDNYTGKPFKETFAQDPLKKIEIKKAVTINTKKILEYKMTHGEIDTISNRFKRLGKIIDKIHNDKAISSLIKKSVDKISEKYQHEPVWTKQMFNDLSWEVSESFVYFITRGGKKSLPEYLKV